MIHKIDVNSNSRNGLQEEKGRFVDRLKPNHIRAILQALGITWTDGEVNPDGWIQRHSTPMGDRTGINTLHGGFILHENAGMAKIEKRIGEDDFYDRNKGGDVVQLVTAYRHNTRDPSRHPEAIEWIREVLNWTDPELEADQVFAAEHTRKGGAGKFVKVPVEVLKSTQVRPAALRVWICLLERCGKGKRYTWAGINTLADDADISVPTTIKALRELKDAGLLVERATGANRAPRRFPIVTMNQSNAVHKKSGLKKL
jgi:hypothetical protein